MKSNLLIIKSVVYRIVRILIILVISLFTTGNIEASIIITLADAVIATVYYYYFDSIWHNYIEHSVEKILLKYKYRKFDER